MKKGGIKTRKTRRNVKMSAENANRKERTKVEAKTRNRNENVKRKDRRGGWGEGKKWKVCM